MSLGATQAVARISAIHDRIGTLASRPVPEGFSNVLQTAMEATGSVEAASPEPTVLGPDTATESIEQSSLPLVGMLGTNLKLNPGATVSFSYPMFTQSYPPAPSAVASGDWAQVLPERGQAWAGAIEGAAAEFGLDPRLLSAVVWAESAFQPNAVSRAGALGLAQLMPKTAEGLGVNPYDPVDNLRGGAKYLRRLLDEFGRVDLAAAAYNAGPGRVRENGGIPYITDPGGYVQQVVKHYRDQGGMHP